MIGRQIAKPVVHRPEIGGNLAAYARRTRRDIRAGKRFEVSDDAVQLAGIVAIFFFGLHELEANVLVPRLMERRVGVSSAALVIALLAGYELGGVIGIVIAVPTAAIVAAILEVSFLDGPTMCDADARPREG